MRARKYNILLGGLAFYPWDIKDIPEEWMDALEAGAGIMDKVNKRERP